MRCRDSPIFPTVIFLQCTLDSGMGYATMPAKASTAKPCRGHSPQFKCMNCTSRQHSRTLNALPFFPGLPWYSATCRNRSVFSTLPAAQCHFNTVAMYRRGC